MKRNINGITSLLKVCQLLNNCHHDILRSNPVKNWLAATNFFDHKPNFTTAKNFKKNWFTAINSLDLDVLKNLTNFLANE